MRRRVVLGAIVAVAAFVVAGGLALRAAVDAEEPGWKYRAPLR